MFQVIGSDGLPISARHPEFESIEFGQALELSFEFKGLVLDAFDDAFSLTDYASVEGDDFRAMFCGV